HSRTLETEKIQANPPLNAEIRPPSPINSSRRPENSFGSSPTTIELQNRISFSHAWPLLVDPTVVSLGINSGHWQFDTYYVLHRHIDVVGFREKCVLCA